ncbi:hypothetical protein Tco_0842684 [Tanacetum coccineum]|uniref:Xylulose kinase-1 n=1 Tax=Tanacetum coccineum TaxID=301880 RepID=A0ABQ5B249_9ASTR
MTTLKFADTYNIVAFLSKPTESDGFEQIVDFLNAHPVRHALTINPTIYISCIKQFWSTIKVKTINGESQLHALVDGKKIIITESSVRRDLQLADENNEAVHKELGDSLVRAATTASSLEAEQDSGGGPRCQETMGDTIAQTRIENVSKHSNDSLLARGNTLQSDEDRLKLDELMALCTTLQNRVLDLEKTKTTQHNEIASLKRRVKKLEKKNSTYGNKKYKTHKKGVVIQELGESTTTISSQLSSQQSHDKDEEEVAIDAIPLAVKSLSIVGWKIYKEGRKSYYQIMRAGGKSQTYMFFSQMLKSFDKEDLEDLYKLLKAKYESTRQWIDLICVIMGELELYLHVGGEEVSPCTTYTFNDVGKEA